MKKYIEMTGVDLQTGTSDEEVMGIIKVVLQNVHITEEDSEEVMFNFNATYFQMYGSGVRDKVGKAQPSRERETRRATRRQTRFQHLSQKFELKSDESDSIDT